MRPDKVVVSNKESGKSDSTVFRFKTVSRSGVEFVSTVKTLDKLFKRPECFGFGIEVLKPDNFLEREGFIERLVNKMYAGRIRRIAVGNKSDILIRFSSTDDFDHGNSGSQSIAS